MVLLEEFAHYLEANKNNDLKTNIDRFLKIHQPIGEAEISIIDSFYNRAKVGYAKYGTTTDRNDLTKKDWVKHAQEEAMDLTIYLQKLEW